jgi:GNAT superfamily N-acetyltransferase
MKKEVINVCGIRFSIEDNGSEVGHAYLYKVQNDLHSKPYGLLEDVYVQPEFRGEGIAAALLDAVLIEARATCYKLIATSRNDGTRNTVHTWYLRLGFEEYGTEFRMNF